MEDRSLPANLLGQEREGERAKVETKQSQPERGPEKREEQERQ